MSFQGISEKELSLWSKIDLFISCLYSLTGHSKDVVDYYSFCGNSTTQPNPNFTKDIKQVIDDFHTYFYKNGNISHMNTGNFEGMGDEYGSGVHLIQMRDVLKQVSSTDTIRTITLFVFNSYQRDKKELGLFEYENDFNLVTFYQPV